VNVDKIMMLGAGLLTAAALQVPDEALAAMKGSERGVIAIIKPAAEKRRIIIYDKQLGGPDTKSKQGSKRRLPYVEQKHKTK
jgi:hypothetical protein